MVVALMLPALAAAVPLAAPEAVESADSSPKRFFPLASVRSNTPAAHVVKPLRSDSAALQNGFMRIDRKQAHPIAINRGPLIVTPQSSTPAAATADGVNVLRGGHAADEGRDKSSAGADAALAQGPDSETATGEAGGPGVLGLFDDGAAAPLGSFHDVLSGKMPSQTASSLRFGWPLPATIAQKLTSAFGMRADPFTGKPEFHGGIDIAAEPGTPVLATAGGQVAQVGEAGNYGRYITLLHPDGSESHYGHLQSASVRVGQIVAFGQQIGAVGATGRTTGPHLDYRISRNGAKLDPLSVLSPPNASLRVAQR